MDTAKWMGELTALHERLTPCFYRVEMATKALEYLKGLLGPAERKNGWQIAEQAGDAVPYGMQRLLRSSRWDEDGAMRTLRRYVREHFGQRGGVLAVDETAFIKKGDKSAGVKRQYCGTTGQVENCQVAVYLHYVSLQGGGAFVDRELYLPEDWTNDRDRCAEAGVPDDVPFSTKPELARIMLRRARAEGFVPAWTTGDAVYGSDPGLRGELEGWGWPYVLGVKTTEPVRPADADGLITRPAGELVAEIPAGAWRRHSAGDGVQGPRLYDWAIVPLVRLGPAVGNHLLLARRSLSDPSDIDLFLVFTTTAVTLADLARAAGWRWTIEVGFEAAKGEVGLGHYEVRQYRAWYRHMTLALAAYAVLAVIKARHAAAEKKDSVVEADPADRGGDPASVVPNGAGGRPFSGAHHPLVALASMASGGFK